MTEREMGFYWVVEKGHKAAQVAFFFLDTDGWWQELGATTQMMIFQK